MKPAMIDDMARARLVLLKHLLVILALFALDLRGLFYKVHMMGPYDTCSFHSVQNNMIQSQALLKPLDTIAKLNDGSACAASGWPSFYSRCETLYPTETDTSGRFSTVLATNCSIDDASNVARIVPQIVMSASMRVDALVAASCQLLLIAQRPPICQDPMVVGFYDRYQVDDQAPTFDEIAEPNSDGETELLRFLDMVSVSFPLADMTCTEGFVLGTGEQGTFPSTVFACASPNRFRSEWLGFLHHPVARFLSTKSWLTTDTISFMAIRYAIRRNAISMVDVRTSSQGTIQVSSSQRVNFSSFGHLYAISVVIDILLLVAHCLSVIQVLKNMMLPQYLELQVWILEFEDPSDGTLAPPESMKKDGWMAKLTGTLRRMSALIGTPARLRAPHDASAPVGTAATGGGNVVFEELQFYSFFLRSFYRTEVYVGLTVITQLVSWVIIVPNAVVWTTTDSFSQQLNGFLTSLKAWVLIAGALHVVWVMLVKLDEQRAYQFVRRTYLSTLELITIGVLVAIADQNRLLSIGEAQYTAEKQRHTDATSFGDGFVAYSNAYDKAQDYVITTRLSVAWMLYGPLVANVGFSLLAIALYLTLKLAVVCLIERQGRQSVLQLLNRSARPNPAAVHVDDGPPTEASSAPQAPAEDEYARLPLEDALGFPLRASRLVRSALSMEILKDGKRYIRPSCYLDFGVMLQHAPIQSRVGLQDIFKAHAPTDDRQLRATAASEAMTPRHANAVATYPLPMKPVKVMSDALDITEADASLRSPDGRDALLPMRKSSLGMSATAANVSMSGRTLTTETFKHEGGSDRPTAQYAVGPRVDMLPRLPPLEKPPRVALQDHNDEAVSSPDW